MLVLNDKTNCGRFFFPGVLTHVLAFHLPFLVCADIFRM